MRGRQGLLAEEEKDVRAARGGRVGRERKRPAQKVLRETAAAPVDDRPTWGGGGEGRTRAQPSRPMAVCAGSERAPRPHPGVAGGRPETRHAGRIHATETGKLQIRAPPRRKALAERMRPGTHRWLLRQSQAPPRSAARTQDPFPPEGLFPGDPDKDTR